MKTKKEKLKVNRDRFIESVYHIVFYGNTARSLNALLSSAGDRVGEDETMILRYSIQSNVMLMFVSFMDELNKYLFEYNAEDIETKARVDAFKKIIDPILSKTNNWTDLRKFRNNVLAHNFRIDSDGYKSVHLTGKLSEYNIPESTIDLATLLKYIDSISKITEQIFQNEYSEAIALVNRFNKSPKKINQSIEKETNEVNKVLIEVNKRINEYNRSIA
ncbi:MAG: hypothetical protein HY252_02380 [Sphingobacteriales bacterium]|nr:hypothetical protein [Sphingobacteriales bacterium]